MPIRLPEIEDIIAIGAELGLQLTRTEVQLMHGPLLEWISSASSFEDLAIDRKAVPVKFGDRGAWYRPGKEEDVLNAFITKCSIKGAEQGPLTGKTIAFKDHVSVAGIPLTFGSHFMNGFIPDFDATVVTRVLEAGGTIVGKLNMEDFSFGGPGFGGVGDYGRPLNPHDLHYVTGGSSSGSAVAAAAGLVDIAFGGDQGGSIRIPASWCGAVGLVATYGLIPHTGVFAFDPTLDILGPLARRVEDIAVVLDCVAGRDQHDPRQIDVPETLPSYRQALSAGVKGMKIGLVSEGFEDCEPDVKDVTLAALGELEKVGASLEWLSIPLHRDSWKAAFPILLEGGRRFFESNLGGYFSKTFYPVSLIETVGRFRQSSGHELPPNVKVLLIAGAYLQKYYHGRLYAQAQNTRMAFKREYDKVLERVDLIAMPTVRIKAFRYRAPSSFEEGLERTIFGSKTGLDQDLIARNAGAFNLTGHPSITLPCAGASKLPIGLMLATAAFREDRLLSAAFAYQASVDWDALFPESPGIQRA